MNIQTFERNGMTFQIQPGKKLPLFRHTKSRVHFSDRDHPANDELDEANDFQRVLILRDLDLLFRDVRGAFSANIFTGWIEKNAVVPDLEKHFNEIRRQLFFKVFKIDPKNQKQRVYNTDQKYADKTLEHLEQWYATYFKKLLEHSENDEALRELAEVFKNELFYIGCLIYALQVYSEQIVFAYKQKLEGIASHYSHVMDYFYPDHPQSFIEIFSAQPLELTTQFSWSISQRTEALQEGLQGVKVA